VDGVGGPWGTGFLGLWAAQKAGLTSHVTLADRSTQLPYIRRNVGLNEKNLLTDVDVRPVLWGDVEAARVLRVDTVFASDLVYKESAYVKLVSTLEALRPRLVILAFACRDPPSERRLLRLLMPAFILELKQCVKAADDEKYDINIWACHHRNRRKEDRLFTKIQSPL